MIKMRLDAKNPSGFQRLKKMLDENVGEVGKNWHFELCTSKAYGDGVIGVTHDTVHNNWNTMFLVDVSIRSHKKATLFALKWIK